MPTPTNTPGSQLRQLLDREQRVFATYPLVARYFPAAAVEDARQRLTRAIDRGDGPGLVIGAPGTGKSLLLQVLATQYHVRFDVVLLACARLCTRRALLQAILFELGLPYKVRDEGDLRLTLLDHLLSEHCPSGLVLLVDEAQALPVALLDELRILTNLVRGGVPRVRLVLAGSSALEESFAHPELESFSQRLAARCYLAPLNRDETWQYIRAQLAASGAPPEEAFAHDAAAAVFDATDGVPRLVNQLCDRALNFAAAKDAPCIDRSSVQEAWSDLQRLPTPWETPIEASDSIADEVVEFGKLAGESAAAVNVYDCGLIDDTELDVEELTEDEIAAAGAPTALHMTAAATDPFDEEFDEEEIVFDSFSGWDDLVRSNLPRVANRRDPGFSTMVQSAIDASPVAANQHNASETASAKNSTTDAPHRPRLRLADVPELANDPVALAKPSPPTAERTGDVSRMLSAFAISTDSATGAVEEQPLLIIEDDAAQNAPQPPVRREEYRNLFSRLRSG